VICECCTAKRAGEQTQEVRVIRVRYCLTCVADIELEIPEGGNEQKIVQDSLEGIPMNKFNVEHVEAEIEDEETHIKRYVVLD